MSLPSIKVSGPDQRINEGMVELISQMLSSLDLAHETTSNSDINTDQFCDELADLLCPDDDTDPGVIQITSEVSHPTSPHE